MEFESGSELDPVDELRQAKIAGRYVEGGRAQVGALGMVGGMVEGMATGEDGGNGGRE